MGEGGGRKGVAPCVHASHKCTGCSCQVEAVGDHVRRVTWKTAAFMWGWAEWGRKGGGCTLRVYVPQVHPACILPRILPAALIR